MFIVNRHHWHPNEGECTLPVAWAVKPGTVFSKTVRIRIQSIPVLSILEWSKKANSCNQEYNQKDHLSSLGQFTTKRIFWQRSTTRMNEDTVHTPASKVFPGELTPSRFLFAWFPWSICSKWHDTSMICTGHSTSFAQQGVSALRSVPTKCTWSTYFYTRNSPVLEGFTGQCKNRIDNMSRPNRVCELSTPVEIYDGPHQRGNTKATTTIQFAKWWSQNLPGSSKWKWTNGHSVVLRSQQDGKAIFGWKQNRTKEMACGASADHFINFPVCSLGSAPVWNTPKRELENIASEDFYSRNTVR